MRGTPNLGRLWWIGGLWHLMGVLGEAAPTGLLIGVALLAVGMLATHLLRRRVPASRDARVTRRTLRQRTRLGDVPRHRDPDASCHSRPRAPAPAAAAD